MRRLFCLFLYLTMIGVSGYNLAQFYYELPAHRPSMRLAAVFGFLAAFGLYLLWIDFLAPTHPKD
jgi:hypothetical protein